MLLAVLGCSLASELDQTGSAPGAQTPLGGEFQVSTSTSYGVFGNSVAADELGDFVVVWASEGRDGDREGIQGQRFDSEGQPLLGEFRVNTYTPNRQISPAVAVDANGDFVVVWTSGRSYFDGPDGSGAGIQGQRFDSEGKVLGAEFQVNTYTTDGQYSPAVATDALGNFVVVWTRVDPYGFTSVVSGQRFDSAGDGLDVRAVIVGCAVDEPFRRGRASIYRRHRSPSRRHLRDPWRDRNPSPGPTASLGSPLGGVTPSPRA